MYDIYERTHMKIIQEFKEFIAKGNVMDLAVGIIIGGAFTAIVTSLVDNIINPFITFISGGNGTEVGGLVIPGTEIDFGAFISAIINFLIIAAVVFLLVKGVNTIKAKTTKPKEDPTIPTCPLCLEEVKEGATRCPHCAGDIK